MIRKVRMESDGHVPDASFPDMVGKRVQSRVVSYLCLYIARKCVICAITNPDNRTGDVTAGSYGAHPPRMCLATSRSHTSCDGSFWSLSMVIAMHITCR